MGSAGDPPAPVGDPPTVTAEAYRVNRPASLPCTVTPVPSGGSPDGTGGSPVLPGECFSTTLWEWSPDIRAGRPVRSTSRRSPRGAGMLPVLAGWDVCPTRPLDP